MYKNFSFRNGSVSVGFDREEFGLVSASFMVCFQHPELSFDIQLLGMLVAVHLYAGKLYADMLPIEDELKKLAGEPDAPGKAVEDAKKGK